MDLEDPKLLSNPLKSSSPLPLDSLTPKKGNAKDLPKSSIQKKSEFGFVISKQCTDSTD